MVPRHKIPEVGARIMDLQAPDEKMSTSAGESGTVYVFDEPKAVLNKIKSAITDSSTQIALSADKPGISNLLDIMVAIHGKKPTEIEREFAGKRYGDLKMAIAEAVVAYLAPVRERYLELRPDENRLEDALTAGAARARAIARQTLLEVWDRMAIGARRR